MFCLFEIYDFHQNALGDRWRIVFYLGELFLVFLELTTNTRHVSRRPMARLVSC